MEREKFGSRIGFILISAGCAIGLGNVWRFPYIVAKYGGALFILIYLAFLIIFGIPIMSAEFAVGRASRKSLVDSFKTLEPKGTKWHLWGWGGIAGNYLVMMFYTAITGWMFAYCLKMIRGDFVGQSSVEISAQFTDFVSDPVAMMIFTVISIVLGFLICSLGLKGGVEKITKWMMLALLLIIGVLVINSLTLPGAAKGIKYYLVPSLDGIKKYGLGEVVFAALGQAFFTLSIGMGSMAIFGTYIGKDRALLGESISIAALDTFVAIASGLIIIPACFSFGIDLGSGPSLVFETLPNVFNHMAGGRIWGSLFFVFMIFAAMSTVVGVFENIIAFFMDTYGWSRRRACAVNCIAMIVLSVPCVLGFNLLSFITPLGAGSNIMDLEDFIVSNNILPIGSIIYVLFCTSKRFGWGWDNFLEEVNTGKGIKFPKWLRVYMTYVLPAVVVFLLVQGYIAKF